MELINPGVSIYNLSSLINQDKCWVCFNYII